MKKTVLTIILFSFFVLISQNNVLSEENNIKEKKEQAIALYTTGNYKEAYKILDSLPSDNKDEEVFLLLANIEEENNNLNSAIQNLNKALNENYSYYKAYYNLGCIFASKKSYLLASNNFELAIKYNKNFASAYYNLACCQIKLKNYELAKKNLIKAIGLEPKNKDYYYNLAYCYKKLHKNKASKKVLAVYDSIN